MLHYQSKTKIEYGSSESISFVIARYSIGLGAFFKTSSELRWLLKVLLLVSLCFAWRTQLPC